MLDQAKVLVEWPWLVEVVGRGVGRGVCGCKQTSPSIVGVTRDLSTQLKIGQLIPAKCLLWAHSSCERPTIQKWVTPPLTLSPPI